MTRTRSFVLFTMALGLALILLCPVSRGIALSGFGKSGLSARAATGTIWSGSLRDAHYGRVPLGDLDVVLRPLSLLTARAEFGVVGTTATGRLTTTGVANLTARLSLAGTFAPLPLDILDLSDVSVTFADQRCQSAEGRVRATFSKDISGLGLNATLSGVARCDGRTLMVPLVSQSGTQRLTLHIAADGHWRALVIVRETDPAAAARLNVAGFRAVGESYTLRVSGTV